MDDVDTPVALALQATKAIQEWCQAIMNAVEGQVALEAEVSTKRLYPLGAWVPLALPGWVGLAVAPKNTHWGSTEQPPPKGGYFLISFQQKVGTAWRVQTCWGVLDGIKRKSGQFKVLDVDRDVLDSVNRNGAGEIGDSHVSAIATMASRGLVALMDRAAVQRLAEDVARDLACFESREA